MASDDPPNSIDLPKIKEATEPPPTSRTERIKQITQAFGFEPFFKGLTLLVGAVAAAALTIRPLVQDLRSPAPVSREHIERLEKIEASVARTQSERDLIATWAEQIERYKAEKVRAEKRQTLLAEGLCRVNGGALGPEWPKCEDLWSKLNVKNPSQGHRTEKVW
jgi:hypothetical protein